MNMLISSPPKIIEFLGTPEAGKTTLIHNLRDSLQNMQGSKNVNVEINQESAEQTPKVFPKGGMAAHFWMQNHTIQSLLRRQYEDSNKIVLVDRGLIDAGFWNYFYFIQKKLSEFQYEASKDYLKAVGVCEPSLIIFLSVSPEVSIARRGGEGRVVTYEFVRNYNKLLYKFIFEEKIEAPLLYIDTSNLNEEETLSIVMEAISNML